MTYLFIRGGKIKDGRMGMRPGRVRIPFSLTMQEQQTVDDAVLKTPTCRNRADFICGAVLWFESLQKPEQISILQRELSSAKPVNGDWVIFDAVGSRVRGWHFPMHSMGQVVGGMALGFCAVPSEVRKEWVFKAASFIAES